MTPGDAQESRAFGHVFLLAQRWQVLGDEFLRQWGLTTKQWLLLATLEVRLDGSATLGEAARAYGTSHQNVKRIAQSLQESGFLDLTRDPDDRRVLRLNITGKNREFWEAHNAEALDFIHGLFGNLNDGETQEFTRLVVKLVQQTEKLQKVASSE